MDNFCQSTFWDANLTWYTENPDFTPCFQKTVLVWVPCAVLWLFLPLEIKLIIKSKKISADLSNFNVIKIILVLLLATLAALNLGNGVYRGDSLNVDIFAFGIKFGTYALAVLLIPYGRKSCQISSGIHLLFWFLSVIAETLIYRSIIMEFYFNNNKGIFSTLIIETISYPLMIVMLVLNTLNDESRKEYSKVKQVDGLDERKKSPEEEATFLSLITFSWLTSALWKGYKKPMEPSDVYELNDADKALTVSRKFEKHFRCNSSKGCTKEVEMEGLVKDSKKPRDKNKSESIYMALLRTVAPCLVAGASLQIISDLIMFANPQILGWIIFYCSSDEPLWKGIFYAFLMGLISILQSFLQEASTVYTNKFGLRLKSSTMYVLYKKTLRLSSFDRRKLTMGEILNIMYIDTSRFNRLAFQLGMFWSAPIQIVLCLYFLYKEIGCSALAGIGIVALITPLNYYISQKLKLLQTTLMKIKDKRIKMMSEILNGIRVLKLYAWERSFQDITMELRRKEIQVLRRQAFLLAITVTIWFAMPIFITLSSFAIFVLIDEKNVLTTTKAFVSLQLIRMVSTPIKMLPEIVSTVVQMNVSISRIRKVLDSNDTNEYTYSGSENSKYAIEILKATFCWDPDKPPSLKVDNFNVPRGSLVAVMGPVGCGKSSLLSALVCEMEKMEGSVKVMGSVGYVTQQPWIQNTSLRNNILFMDEMHHERYNQVIKACALEHDLENLPAHDETEIGARGINLSGGQKQRVNVARTIYRSDDIYLLDDPLGAVDAHVAKHIFNEVIGPAGLLKNKIHDILHKIPVMDLRVSTQTRILVTHNLTFMRDVDEIFFMNNGEIIERGTYEQIISRKGVASDYFKQHMTNENQGQTIITAETVKCVKSIKQNQMLKNGGKSQKSVSNDAKLTIKENLTKGTTTFPVYQQYFKSVGFFWCIITLIGQIGIQVFTQASAYWLSLWSEDTKEEEEVNSDLRTTRLTGFGLLGLGQTLSTLIVIIISSYATLRASRVLHDDMLYRVLRSPMSFFDTTPTGRILNRFSQDLEDLDQQLPISVRTCCMTILSALAFVVTTCAVIPAFILPIIAVMFGYTLIQRFLMATKRQLKRILSSRRSFLISHVSGSVDGTTIIRACGAVEHFEAQFRKYIDESTAANYMMNMCERWLSVRFNLLGNFLLFCASLFTVFNKGALSPGLVGFVITNISSLIIMVKFIVKQATKVETLIVSVERIHEYCHLPSEAAWDIADFHIPSNWPEQGQIIFQDYCTRYREGMDLVLKDINFTIKPKGKVGVVGRTGAGKSSLTLALFRLIEAVGGEILIDGVDVQKMGLSDLRSRLTIIPQDPVLFSGTLRLNLDPFTEHDDQRLWVALEHSHLKPFVASLEQGLDHPVTEGGLNLSVGQRQLVCLARALLRNTKILILDEATASVDMDTDDLIQETIRKEFVHSTVITIAHRINTILDYDRVMVLDQGCVVEFDAPRNLMNNERSLFHELAKDANLL